MLAQNLQKGALFSQGEAPLLGSRPIEASSPLVQVVMSGQLLKLHPTKKCRVLKILRKRGPRTNSMALTVPTELCSSVGLQARRKSTQSISCMVQAGKL